MKLTDKQLKKLYDIYKHEKETKKLLEELLEDIKNNCKPVDYKPLPKNISTLKATFLPISTSIEQELTKLNNNYREELEYERPPIDSEDK